MKLSYWVTSLSWNSGRPDRKKRNTFSPSLRMTYPIQPVVVAMQPHPPKEERLVYIIALLP